MRFPTIWYVQPAQKICVINCSVVTYIKFSEVVPEVVTSI